MEEKLNELRELAEEIFHETMYIMGCCVVLAVIMLAFLLTVCGR